jgi:putative phosphoesterase
MNILVFSDSHGRGERIDAVIELQVRKPDAIIFLGDGLRDIAYCNTGNIPIYAVRGNCDIYNYFRQDNVEEDLLFEIGCKRVFITHGHKYGVKSGIGYLISEAAKKEADIVLFGHTHSAFEAIINEENAYGLKLTKPMYVMNPGSIGDYNASFGTVEIDREGRVLLSHGNL